MNYQKGKMKLKDYLEKYRISVTEFAYRVNLSATTIWHYMSERRRPYQETAERIEKETDGLVTVKELRGTDKRGKK